MANPTYTVIDSLGREYQLEGSANLTVEQILLKANEKFGIQMFNVTNMTTAQTIDRPYDNGTEFIHEKVSKDKSRVRGRRGAYRARS